MILRSIQEADIGECAKLFADVFASEPWNEGWDEALALERLTHFYHSMAFSGVLAEQDRIVGFALGNIEPFYFGSMFYLREMCIQASLQNQGIGGEILEALEDDLISQGVKNIYLTTERSIPAAKFYQKNGYNFSEKMGFYAKNVNS
tara:strand:+ start:246 stop:686 length:441 start_codon:yes stop_codon:yes gene_type:complete